ncbi:helix-turn-helix domain-containing protein [Nocardia amikacinitolerans]|uniref:helix-turn-helix domain-containing protein n=1 Tax=Nocardia amikacinitolerans TaxID=756689 RepID=UPI0020A27F15|nr:helix-turn-helix transcriptional regulator [Nocardia amikacinitolerans]
MPSTFWQTDQMRDALATWHMGLVIHAYRTHPYHGRALPQEVVAAWLGLTQALLSRIEKGTAPDQISKLTRWAEALGIPGELLWFKLPHERRPTDVDAPPGVEAHTDLARPIEEANAERCVAPVTAGLVHGLSEPGGDPTNRREALRVLSGSGLVAGAALQDLILGAARESAQLTNALDRPTVDPTTLSEAAEDLHRLAGAYALDPDLHRIFVHLTVLRDQLGSIIHRAGKLTDLQELYVLFAATCTLLASVSHDLAEPQAAMIQTRTAARFAELAGHRSLAAWVSCTRAMIAAWWGSPEQVLTEVHKSGGATGISGIRLAGLAARAHAQLGNRPAAIDAMRAARRQRERQSGADSLRGLGPIFDFSPARQHYYDATTYARLGEWTQVHTEAGIVIDLYAPEQSSTWPTTLTLAQIHLAHARLHFDGPTAAREALEPVLAVPTGQRIPQVTTALRALRDDLQAQPFAATAGRRELVDAVDAFAVGADYAH